MPHPPPREFIPRRPANVRFVRFMGTRGTICRPQCMEIRELCLDFEDILESQHDAIFPRGSEWDGRGFRLYAGDGRLLDPEQTLAEASSGATIVLFWAFNRVEGDSIHFDPPQFLPPGCREQEVWELPPDEEEKTPDFVRRHRLARRMSEVRGHAADHEKRMLQIERRKERERATKYDQYALRMCKTEKALMPSEDILWKFEKQYPGGVIPRDERERLIRFFGLSNSCAARGMGKNNEGKLCYYPEGRASSTSSSGSGNTSEARQEDDGFGHLRGSRNDYQYEQRRVAAGRGSPSMQVNLNAKPKWAGIKVGGRHSINPARLEKGGKGQAAGAWSNGGNGSNGTRRAGRGAEALSSEVAGKGPSKFAPPGRTRNKR